jgi:hypothetical protein
MPEKCEDGENCPVSNELCNARMQNLCDKIKAQEKYFKLLFGTSLVSIVLLIVELARGLH